MQSYVGEIRMCGFNFPPVGWAFCDGSILSINEYEVLFILIGTTYGGDGTHTFALPNLLGRLPMHRGGTAIFGDNPGAEDVALTISDLPSHTHQLVGLSTTGTITQPSPNTLLATAPAGLGNAYGSAANGEMSAAAISITGGSQGHPNIAPYLAVNFIISLFGVFPSQN